MLNIFITNNHFLQFRFICLNANCFFSFIKKFVNNFIICTSYSFYIFSSLIAFNLLDTAVAVPLTAN